MMPPFLRMVRALLSGDYRPVPWKSIVLGTILLLYIFSPVDLLPDYIPFVGVIDDIALLVFFLRSLGRDVNAFREWEKEEKE